MFNIRVFKLRDIIKHTIGLIIIFSLILIISKFVNKIKDNIEEKREGIFNFDLIGCIDESSGIIKNTNNNNSEIKAYKSDFFEDILKSQIGSIDTFSEIDDSEIPNTNIENDSINNKEQSNETELAKTRLNTEVVTNNPISLNYNTQYKSVKIKNETSHELTQEMMTPNINIENKNILLFHTHTCESYTSSDNFSYTPTGNFRTTDLNYSVVRVGEELTNQLKNYGYNVIHDTTYHDYPAYNGSYTRSLSTVQKILQTTPTDIIFDIHRDAIGSRSDYAPCVKIGDDVAAQIMFVVGSDEGGLWHPNWNENLKFAIKVQEKAEEMYPGLFKPITLTKYRYNQHTGKYASIIEVGATGNTLEQCLNSMKYLSKVLDEVMR